MPLQLDRRSFLALVAGTSAGATGMALLEPFAWLHSAGGAQATPLSPLRSRNGRLEVDLVAQNTAVAIPGGPARALTYNGQLPGPRLEVEPGDRVRIQLHNRLDRPTNLHYHGLHIPPNGTADNVFVSVAPGASYTYAFTLPPNHPAGTFYYHPHRHGSVADQVFGGLGGVLLVRGDLNRIPELQAATEQVLFLKDLPGPEGFGPLGAGWRLGREGPVLTVNGQVRPDFSLASGGLLRLRIVNGSNARFWRLALEEHPLHLIATDGGAVAAPLELQDLLLAPGERAEVLVRGQRQSGRYQLLILPYARGSGATSSGMGSADAMGEGRAAGGREEAITIATLTYHGAVAPLPLPKQLLPVEALPAPVRTRRLLLHHGMDAARSMVFLIHGRAYAHERIDTRVRIGDTEDWVLVNAGVMDHPFHLHLNPFQVISRNGMPEPFLAWRDVVLVRQGETVRIRTRFDDFAGRTVYHCHILDHEDLGMMGILEIRA